MFLFDLFEEIGYQKTLVKKLLLDLIRVALGDEDVLGGKKMDLGYAMEPSQNKSFLTKFGQ